MILRIQFFSYQKIYPVNFCLQASIAPVSLPGNLQPRGRKRKRRANNICTQTLNGHPCILTCAIFLKKLWDSDILYRICSKDCVPISHHFWQKLVCRESYPKSTGSSHYRWYNDCSLQLWIALSKPVFCQKWPKIGTQSLEHILYNISESHNFFKKSAHVNVHTS